MKQNKAKSYRRKKKTLTYDFVVIYHNDVSWVPKTAYNRMVKANDKLNTALNKIAMLGSGELAYTSDFTEQVLKIATEALGIKKRWPY